MLACYDWKVGLFFDEAMKFKKYVVEATGALPNVEVYDFQADKAITRNLDLYRDHTHYSPAINQFIIESIARGTYRVTPQNIDEHIAALKKQLDNFNPDPLKLESRRSR